MASAFRWVQQHGIASESAYPYTGRGTCDTAKENKPVATVSGSRSVSGESGLKSAVAGRAVSIGVDASCLQLYHGGILDKSGCSGALDHGVLAVGYGTSAGTPYFKVQIFSPPTTRYLLHRLLAAYYLRPTSYTTKVKNSWGTSWGESGFFRVVEGKGMLGIGEQSVYPTGVKKE